MLKRCFANKANNERVTDVFDVLQKRHAAVLSARFAAGGDVSDVDNWVEQRRVYT